MYLRKAILETLTADVSSIVGAGNHLSKTLTVTFYEENDVEEELETLENVDTEARAAAKDTERKITVVTHWVAC